MDYDAIKRLVKGKNEFSSISILPDELKYEIHLLLDRDFTEENIVKHIKLKYGEAALCPDMQELKEYQKVYRSIKKALSFKDVKSTLQKYIPNFESLLEKVSINSMYSFKEILLKEMIVKCLNRMRRVEKSAQDKDKVVVNQEKLIIDYIDEIRTLVDMLIKLEDEAKNDKTYIVNMISAEMTPLLEAVKQTVAEVCPEKSNEFKNILKEKLGKVIVAIDGKEKLIDNISVSDSLMEMDMAQKVLTDVPDDGSIEQQAVNSLPVDELPYNIQQEKFNETNEQ